MKDRLNLFFVFLVLFFEKMGEDLGFHVLPAFLCPSLTFIVRLKIIGIKPDLDEIQGKLFLWMACGAMRNVDE